MPYDIHEDVLFPLAKLGVTRIEVDFSGGGDSGQINGIEYYNGDQQKITDDFVPKQKYVSGTGWVTVSEPKHKLPPVGTQTKRKGVRDEETGKYSHKEVEVPVTVEGALEEHVYERLSNCGVDWYNNEGGQGTYWFRLSDDKSVWRYDFEVHVNYTVSELEHSSSGLVGQESD